MIRVLLNYGGQGDYLQTQQLLVAAQNLNYNIGNILSKYYNHDYSTCVMFINKQNPHQIANKRLGDIINHCVKLAEQKTYNKPLRKDNKIKLYSKNIIGDTTS